MKNTKISASHIKSLVYLIGILISTSACRTTNTFLDGFIYPATEYYEQLSDDPQAIAICTNLEEIGYQFDDFSVDVLGIEVTYSDGNQAQFPHAYSVSPIMLTTIARDYNNPDILSDDEFEGLQKEAQTFCTDYYQEANELDLSLPLSSILFWDYLNGVRGGFWFSETCEITGDYGWGTGSYASSYELDPSATCPSGHIRY